VFATTWTSVSCFLSRVIRETSASREKQSNRPKVKHEYLYVCCARPRDLLRFVRIFQYRRDDGSVTTFGRTHSVYTCVYMCSENDLFFYFENRNIVFFNKHAGALDRGAIFIVTSLFIYRGNPSIRSRAGTRAIRATYDARGWTVTGRADTYTNRRNRCYFGGPNTCITYIFRRTDPTTLITLFIYSLSRYCCAVRW